MKMKQGTIVHIDVDQWGRVATNATIIENKGKKVLVNAHSIRANILVNKNDCVIFKKLAE